MGWSDKHMFVYLVDPKVMGRHQDGLRWSQEGEGASRPLHLHERSGLGTVGLNRQVVEFCSFLANVKSVASTATLAVWSSHLLVSFLSRDVTPHVVGQMARLASSLASVAARRPE